MRKSTPKHRAVYEVIKNQIETKIYPENSLLPSENEMCTLFKVTRPTIRQALNRLENDGYIIRHQGKGSIVRNRRLGLGILALKGVTQALDTQGNLTTRISKKPVVKPWPGEFKYHLTDVEQSLGCINMERIRLVDNVPVMMEKTHLVNIHLPRFCNRKFENRSLFETLSKEYNIDIKGGEQAIRSVLANKTVAEILQISERKAILQIDRSINTNKPNLRIFSEIFCCTDNFYLQGSF